MVLNLSSVTTLIEPALAALREGATLLETDIRVGAIAALGLGLGLLLGAYLHSVLSRRGNIAAMRKDLDHIARLQEGILESLSRQRSTDQDLTNLKYETYQMLDRTLHTLSSELSSILRRDKLGNGGASDSDSAGDPPARKAIEKRLDEFTDLVIPSRIAVSQQSLDLVMGFQREFERLRQLTGGVAGYGFFADLQHLVDDTRVRLLEAAGADLRATTPDFEKHPAV